MIDVKKLTEAKRVEVTYYSESVNGDFVKSFRKKFGLTQVALSNILGVKKKTIEKWEQGVNNIGGSSAVLLSLLSSNEELLHKLYTVKQCATAESTNDEFVPLYSAEVQPKVCLILEPFNTTKAVFSSTITAS